MAKIKRSARPNQRVTVHNDTRTYRIVERAPDIRLRHPKEKPYRDR